MSIINTWLRIANGACQTAGGNCNYAVLMRCATILSTSLAMLLLDGRVLPVFKAKRWGVTLIAVQISLYVVACFSGSQWLEMDLQFLTADSLAGTMLPFLWVAAWLGLFVIWPALHCRRESQAGEKHSCNAGAGADDGADADAVDGAV